MHVCVNLIFMAVYRFSLAAAIRQDRTRGGRSSYEGCSPHGKPRPSPVQRKVKRPSVGDEAKAGVVSAVPGVDMMNPEEEGKSHRQLVAILNHSSRHGQQVGWVCLFALLFVCLFVCLHVKR